MKAFELPNPVNVTRNRARRLALLVLSIALPVAAEHRLPDVVPSVAGASSIVVPDSAAVSTAVPSTVPASPTAMSPTATGRAGTVPIATAPSAVVPGVTAPPAATPSTVSPVATVSVPDPLQAAEATCTERIPEGKTPPKVTERFPSTGKSGHEAVLVVELQHGPGERVLPSALHVDSSNPAYRAVQSAGFRFPSVRGPSAPRLHRAESEGQALTRFELPLLVLPSEAGQQQLVLPSLPIAVARSSGEIITLCTSPHRLLVQDPTANEPNARPKPNPAARRQRELWEVLRNVAYGGGAGLLVAALFALALRAWLKRPKKAPPPPPPRPPWEVAFEALHDIRQARLIESGRLEEHFDQVSAVVRRYLGERYGFDGLESTTHEIVSALSKQAVPGQAFEQVQRFLNESDLVKFANQAPTEAQCYWLWESAENVVKQTMIAETPQAAIEAPTQEGPRG